MRLSEKTSDNRVDSVPRYAVYDVFVESTPHNHRIEQRVETFSTSQLAERTNVSVETLRYYERRGLLPKPACRASGYRTYSTADVERMTFIQSAKGLGFTLREISELLELVAAPSTTCDRLRAEGMRKVAEIDEKMAQLERKKRQLQGMINNTCQAEQLADCDQLQSGEAIPTLSNPDGGENRCESS